MKKTSRSQMLLKSEVGEDLEEPPSYTDFDAYLPWACAQLGIETPVNISRTQQQEYHSTRTQKSRSTSKAKNKDIISYSTSEDYLSSISDITDMVTVTTVYDKGDNLVQLKFINNKMIPPEVMKVVGLIIHFHTHLTNVTIDRGLNNAAIHEINKWCSTNYITDLCLDNTNIASANYDVLLDNQNCVKQLSLSRCKIDDKIMKKIALKLYHSMPASKTLSILKLSSNRITDEGAKYIAEALKTNRKLSYLNMSDNSITDDGFIAILDVINEFPVHPEDLVASKRRLVSYLRDKRNLVNQLITDTQSLNLNLDEKSIKSGKTSKKKPAVVQNPIPPKKRDSPSLTTIEDVKSWVSFDTFWSEKAQYIADAKMGDFEDPYAAQYVYEKDGLTYCYGNNILVYINLAYNNITYISVKKLLGVLLKQKMFNRTPRGLVNVSIEGNCLPASCEELNNINEILEESLTLSSKKKKPKTLPSDVSNVGNNN